MLRGKVVDATLFAAVHGLCVCGRCSMPSLRHALGFDEEVAQHEEFRRCFAWDGSILLRFNATNPQSAIALVARCLCWQFRANIDYLVLDSYPCASVVAFAGAAITQ